MKKNEKEKISESMSAIRLLKLEEHKNIILITSSSRESCEDIAEVFQSTIRARIADIRIAFIKIRLNNAESISVWVEWILREGNDPETAGRDVSDDNIADEYVSCLPPRCDNADIQLYLLNDEENLLRRPNLVGGGEEFTLPSGFATMSRMDRWGSVPRVEHSQVDGHPTANGSRKSYILPRCEIQLCTVVVLLPSGIATMMRLDRGGSLSGEESRVGLGTRF
ncbi:hypothetical protein AVEN_269291-1 [Araneus ventricosus]|uniref:Uncharacterized protein n=1 Tax=Araneus ventricosus TaxID=182803 RepID=A0A4Y2L7A8_ARAVE|nr:hypothetical protein AVEN_269291-1 [Araneus ventricosus]